MKYKIENWIVIKDNLQEGAYGEIYLNSYMKKYCGTIRKIFYIHYNYNKQFIGYNLEGCKENRIVNDGLQNQYHWRWNDEMIKRKATKNEIKHYRTINKEIIIERQI